MPGINPFSDVSGRDPFHGAVVSSLVADKLSGSVDLCLDALPFTEIRIVEMLVDHVTLLLVQLPRELVGEPLVENVVDRDPHLGPALLALAPVEHQFLPLDLVKKLTRYRLDLFPFFLS